MSYYGNHEPESIDGCRFGEDPRETGGEPRESPCACEPEGFGVGQMCSACQAAYGAWRARVDAGLPLALPRPGEEFEPCGQQFTDGPLPDDLPF